MSWIQPVVRTFEKISSSSRLLAWMYSRPYRRVVENEIDLGKLNQNDTILNIGCGAVPFTALYLASLTGARIFALDVDSRATELANKCIHKAGLEHRITILHQDGSQAFERPFSASIVSLQASPKAEILKALQTSALPGARLIFRLPSPTYYNHYDSLLINMPVQAQASQPMRTFDRSVLYLQTG